MVDKEARKEIKALKAEIAELRKHSHCHEDPYEEVPGTCDHNGKPYLRLKRFPNVRIAEL